MSYILDALKKSDSERKQGDVPNLQTIHIPISSEPQAPLGLYGLISVLLLLLAFLVGWLIADKEPANQELVDNESMNTISRDAKPTATVAANESPHKSSVQAQAVIAERMQVSNVKPSKPRIKQQAIAAPVIIPPAVIEVQHKENTAQKEDQISIPDLSDIPYLHEMPDYQQQSIPQMTFAGHVYSSTPSSRSVIINDVFMSEGDALLPGIKVIEITASGVVFSLHEGFFRIDILQDWSFD